MLEPATFQGRRALRKVRLPKAYRDARLDRAIRDARTRDEANLLAAARRAGVRVPLVYEVDRAACAITMEQVPGRPLRDALAAMADADSDDAAADDALAALGAMVGRLHDAGIAHGDLTTGNVLHVPHGRVPPVPPASVPPVPPGNVPPAPAGLCLLDFGLGSFTVEPEDRAVDLHVLEQTLLATAARHEALFAAFLRGYASAACAPATLRRLGEVRERGRYR